MANPSIALYFVLTLACAACGRREAAIEEEAPSVLPEGEVPTAYSEPPYRFKAPEARFALPTELREISALTVVNDGYLGAVEDESGVLYALSLETGAVTDRIPFGRRGDYEGVELAADRLFALRSDGSGMMLRDWSSGHTTDLPFDLGLGAEACNAEGLGSDGKRLLVVCKEEDEKGRNRLYGADFGGKLLGSGPLFSIDPAEVPGKGRLRPSALAVHPVTGHIVVLSSKRESLISLDTTGEVVATWDLRPAGLEQPEGLAFLPNGDLLLSSEGKLRQAEVLRFRYLGGVR